MAAGSMDELLHEQTAAARTSASRTPLQQETPRNVKVENLPVWTLELWKGDLMKFLVPAACPLPLSQQVSLQKVGAPSVEVPPLDQLSALKSAAAASRSQGAMLPTWRSSQQTAASHAVMARL